MGQFYIFVTVGGTDQNIFDCNSKWRFTNHKEKKIGLEDSSETTLDVLIKQLGLSSQLKLIIGIAGTGQGELRWTRYETLFL